ncbi:hypothetical protein Taro_054722 [Colocasia esculenta]|uniref:N-acetyltransferase domain-containing protein n=1 Tax=Colocasia esculenta TaxID=4460 RepID=A0A843XS33_COLES|nr:hypothetical protein [Colocasia esculenta]
MAFLKTSVTPTSPMLSKSRGLFGVASVCGFRSREAAQGFGWGVRRMAMVGEEMRMVAHIQAEAFHEPVALFDDFFFQFFEAEVLSALIYKLRNSAPDSVVKLFLIVVAHVIPVVQNALQLSVHDLSKYFDNRYACLVAELIDTSNPLCTSLQELVGVVDVSIQRDEDVMLHLDGAEEYLYVSGIAVLKSYRRRKVASALLKACDAISQLWGCGHLALHAYEDDLAARELYSKAGYKTVSGDSSWINTWFGKRPRVLMIKQSSS